MLKDVGFVVGTLLVVTCVILLIVEIVVVLGLFFAGAVMGRDLLAELAGYFSLLP